MARKKNSDRGAYTSGPQRGGLANITAKASHLSLAEEARNTERHHSWHSDLKLRHTQVSFVSAGPLNDTVDHDIHERVPQPAQITTADVLPNAEQLLASMTMDIEDPYNHSHCHRVLGKESDILFEPKDLPRRTTVSTVTVSGDNDIFIVDTEGATPHPKIPPPTIRCSLSPVPSNSSEEVVVFRGRNRSRQGRGTNVLHQAERLQTRQPMNSNLGFREVHDNTNEQVGKPRKSRINSSLARRKVVRSIDMAEGTTFKSRRVRDSMEKEQDQIMEDYIQNMRANAEENCDQLESKSFGLQDPRAFKDDMGQAETVASLTKEAILNSKSGWSKDLDEFEDLSSPVDVPDAIASILSRRQRPSGVQYLVVREGYDPDDARWITRSCLEKMCAPELVSVFDFNEKERANTSAVSSDIDAEALRILDTDDEAGDIGSEDDLIKSKKSSITDEEIALRLAKQEQLGFGSSEVMLFAGNEVEGWSDDKGINRLLQATGKYSGGNVMTRRRNVNGTASARGFGDALIQDPYGGFDVMDHERSSLRRRTKGGRGVLPIELSDSELEAQVLLTWENDRTKKKLQKQERLKLRAHGLLNKRNKVDMKAKYREGMSIVSFKEEIRDFLDSEERSVSFPPMDKEYRKRVHEFANAFNLKSRSVGGGRNRYPSLYKTSRTLPYSDKVFKSIESRLNAPRFLPRRDIGVKRTAAARLSRESRFGGGTAAAVSYRDGEIVGAAAPELGTDNKGRAMLEKMGWSTGTALGALNNKGIMQPVVHIVKTTKAGLG